MKNRKSMIVNGIAVALTCSLSLSALAESPAAEVKIVRDEYGMPHIYASTTHNLFYGYGYVVAQDRLFQMEMARRSTQGTVSEVLGSQYLNFDKDIRQNYWPASIHAQIAALPAEDKAILQGYADGMNAWIDEVNRHPDTLMPKQFTTFGFKPQHWQPFDVAMVFVGTMANRFSDSTSEIDNLALLTALKDKYGAKQGMAVFNQLKWLVNPNAPTTIAPQESRYPLTFDLNKTQTAALLPRYDQSPPMLERLAKGDDGALLALTATQNRATIAAQFARSGANGLAGYPTTSNMWVIGKSKAQDAKAIMVNGPQFGWYAPAYTYGIGLHGAGYDVTGNTPFAYPGLVFGHNGAISWGSTAGFGDDVDIFAEQLSDKKPGYYLHNGQWVKMLSRDEVINVKDAQAVDFTVYRTVHGNVIKTDPATHTAYAKARAWDGKEVASLLAWTHQMKAKNWQEWTQQAAKQALTINWYYADVNGNIGYVHTGAYPQRQPGHDPRLPVPGTGKWDWQGVLPFALNPKVYNPASGYIANWNNAPQQNYPASDLFAFLWGGADRVTEIARLIDKQPTFTYEQAWDLIGKTSRQDLNLRLFLPALQGATASLPQSDPRQQMVSLLSRWDGQNRLAADGKTLQQPGSAILNAWLTSMLKKTVVAAVPAPFNQWYGASGYETTQDGPTGSLNISVGAKILYEALQGDRSAIGQAVDLFGGKSQQAVILEALQEAWQTLCARYGTDISQWKTPAMALTFRANNFFGVPQAAPQEARHQAEYQNRGTENDMIVFSPAGQKTPVLAWDVVAPGQSGFVAPNGTVDKHYDDQLKMYETFGRKPLWLTPQEVNAHKESQEILHLKP
ncbi:penicillin G acylase [[Enterobacter] lignolyticus]|uniref:Peptidase S45 penicillin amidase n=1 Tax=Enterobacter lignolyticus (strain SCF1) TaxID=701347 RepID=E3GBI1_ENTLS|nr:penicillin G acylase [[Enterobacter] lignolyticus]ADO50023.1 peptidase S45 penicillin amidase [[Enterobacter] lignolyticus SCF1]